jgi:hypothetical protein
MSSAPLSPTEALAAVAASCWPCLLCGAPDAANTGVFVPTSAEAFFVVGAPAQGKMRVLLYRLCDRCLGDASRDLESFERLLLQAVGSRERQ